MKKITYILVTALALLLLASCASTGTTSSSSSTVVLGKDGVPRPDWVTKDISTQDVHYAVGYGKMATYANSRRRAEADARTQMSEWISVTVQGVVTTYTNDAGEIDNRQALDAFEELSIQNAEAWLSGATKEDEWVAADEGVYVLLSIPVENVASQMALYAEDAADETFIENEAAAAANAKMNDAIAKYFGSNDAE